DVADLELAEAAADEHGARQVAGLDLHAADGAAADDVAQGDAALALDGDGDAAAAVGEDQVDPAVLAAVRLPAAALHGEDGAGDGVDQARALAATGGEVAELADERALRQGAGAGDVEPPQRRGRLGRGAVAAGDDQAAVGLARAEGAEHEVADVELAAGGGRDGGGEG